MKVKLIKDKKICEFNYKMLNNCLPCKTNLFKWNIVTDSKCNLCGKEENAEHMLFLCFPKYKFWQVCLKLLDMKFSPAVIYGTSGCISKVWCVSVIQYCMYKINFKNSEKTFQGVNSYFMQLLSQLNEFHELYSINNYIGVCRHLKNILSCNNKYCKVKCTFQ